MAIDSELYDPTLTERSRQEFVLSLKLLANGPVQQKVRDEFALNTAAGSQQRQDLKRALSRSQSYRSWAVFTHASQSMMWRAIEATAQRVAGEGSRRLAALRSGASSRPRGTLQLDPTLNIPPPVINTEIHRQPGGFVGSDDPTDVLAGLRYLGASRIYSPGKRNDIEATDARGALLVSEVRRRFAGARPKRILELGCGIGVASQAVARAFPDAEYHAIDVAAGLLRFAHLLAEERGVVLNLYQRDAAQCGFPDQHFDLIVSNIMFHETNSARLPQILRECWRVLRAGAHMCHVDVPTQVSRLALADQFMNEWQVRWNGEPFWAAFAQLDMRQEIIDAGFDAQLAFAEHIQRSGAAPAYVFGATR